MLRREVLSAKEVLKATEDKLQYEVAVLQLECAHADTFKERTVSTRASILRGVQGLPQVPRLGF